MADIINFLLLISVMFLLLGVGLSTPFGKVLAIATQYQLVLRGLVANFVIVPCVLTFALQGVPLGPDIVIGLLVLAAVPVAAMAPPFVGMGQGDVAYAVGRVSPGQRSIALAHRRTAGLNDNNFAHIFPPQGRLGSALFDRF